MDFEVVDCFFTENKIGFEDNFGQVRSVPVIPPLIIRDTEEFPCIFVLMMFAFFFHIKTFSSARSWLFFKILPSVGKGMPL